MGREFMFLTYLKTLVSLEEILVLIQECVCVCAIQVLCVSILSMIRFSIRSS